MCALTKKYHTFIIEDQATNLRAPQQAALAIALLTDMNALEQHCSLRLVTQTSLDEV